MTDEGMVIVKAQRLTDPQAIARLRVPAHEAAVVLSPAEIAGAYVALAGRGLV